MRTPQIGEEPRRLQAGNAPRSRPALDEDPEEGHPVEVVHGEKKSCPVLKTCLASVGAKSKTCVANGF
jgi:hypothetical protein